MTSGSLIFESQTWMFLSLCEYRTPWCCEWQVSKSHSSANCGLRHHVESTRNIDYNQSWGVEKSRVVASNVWIFPRKHSRYHSISPCWGHQDHKGDATGCGSKETAPMLTFSSTESLPLVQLWILKCWWANLSWISKSNDVRPSQSFSPGFGLDFPNWTMQLRGPPVWPLLRSSQLLHMAPERSDGVGQAKYGQFFYLRFRK